MIEQNHPASNDRGQSFRLDSMPSSPQSTPEMEPRLRTAKWLHMYCAKLEMRHELREQERLCSQRAQEGLKSQTSSPVQCELEGNRSEEDGSATALPARFSLPCVLFGWLSKKRLFRRDDQTPNQAKPPALEIEDRRVAGLFPWGKECPASVLRRHLLPDRNGVSSCQKARKNVQVDQV